MPLVTSNFGGLVPKLSARKLPDAASQTASNLTPDTPEFRPIKDDLTVVSASGVTNPKTIYRLQRNSDGTLNENVTSAATWKINAGLRSYARVPLNDDTTERTVMTYDDGSAPARVIDAQGTDRQLGVPAPTDAPECTVTVTEQFSTDDRESLLNQIYQGIVGLVYDASAGVWVGGTRPGTSTPGFMDLLTIDGENLNEQVRMFRLTSTGGANTGTVTDGYVGSSAAQYQTWVFDTSMWAGFATSPPSGTTWPAWAGANKDHRFIPFIAYGGSITVDAAALRTTLAAIIMPGTVSTPLFTSDQLDDIDDKVDQVMSAMDDAAAPKISQLKSQVDSMHTLLSGGADAAHAAAVAAFYAKTEISDKFDTAILNLAESAWNQAVQANAYTDPV